jgi:hypothetical protein
MKQLVISINREIKLVLKLQHCRNWSTVFAVVVTLTLLGAAVALGSTKFNVDAFYSIFCSQSVFLWLLSHSQILENLCHACPYFRLSFHMSVRMQQLVSHWTGFHEILYLRIFRKYIEKILISLRSDENNVYFTWMSMYICSDILLNYS